MKADLLLIKDDRTGKIRLEARGSKLPIVLGLLFLGILGCALATVGYRTLVSHGPYEGTVVEIENDWFSGWFGADGFPRSRIRIQTPQGETITRVVGDQVLALDRIEVGDYVTKAAGVFAPPRPRGKKTVNELMKELPGS